MKKRALFIDRDGIINHMILQKEGIFDSPQNIQQIKLVSGIIEVIDWLNKENIPIIEITNQPGFALGKIDLEILENIEKEIHGLLNRQKVYIDKIYRCFHHPESKIEKYKIDCKCRKPRSGLLLQAAKEMELDLKRSVILGDNATDMEAGKKVGCKTILFSHTNDLPHKIAINKSYNPEFRVYSHSEVIPILIKLFK